MNKSPSESNISKLSSDTTPPSYVFLRGKRARDAEWCDDLRNFREEMKVMIRELMTEQETKLKKLFAPSLAEIQNSNRSIDASVTQVIAQNEELTKKIELLENERMKDRERITLLEDRFEELQRGSRKTNIEITKCA